MAAVEGEEALGVGGFGGVAGDAPGEFDGLPAGGFEGDAALDEEGLADVGEGEVPVERGGGPYGPLFGAAVLELDRFAEVGRGALFEVAFEVVEQLGLVGLDGEKVMRVAPDEEVGEFGLRWHASNQCLPWL